MMDYALWVLGKRCTTSELKYVNSMTWKICTNFVLYEEPFYRLFSLNNGRLYTCISSLGWQFVLVLCAKKQNSSFRVYSPSPSHPICRLYVDVTRIKYTRWLFGDICRCWLDDSNHIQWRYVSGHASKLGPSSVFNLFFDSFFNWVNEQFPPPSPPVRPRIRVGER